MDSFTLQSSPVSPGGTSQVDLNILDAPYFKAGQTAYDTGTGFWIGIDGGVPKISFGSSSGNKVTWNGTTLAVTGTLTATTGTIGGFTIDTDNIRDAANSFGLASTVTGGDDVRFWAGNTFANRATAPFRVTEAGAVTATSITITGGSVVTSVLSGLVGLGNTNVAAMGWSQTCVLYTSDSDTVSWNAGNFTTAAGVSYSISAGNTGNMLVKTYIYLDTGVSTTAYQTTTTASTAVGSGKVIVAVARPANAQYLSLPGISGNYASTPDSAAVSITGDIDIRVRVATDDWSPSGSSQFMAKDDRGTNREWEFSLNTTGLFYLAWWESGGTLREVNSSVVNSITDGAIKYVRITLDVNDGAGGHVVRFYTGDNGINWVQLGTDRNAGAFTTSIRDLASPVTAGATADGATPFTGKIYYAELRNGIDGTVVASFDASDGAAGETSFASVKTGEVWTVNTSGGTPAALVTNREEATFFILTGMGGQNIDASNIVASSITANEIAANSITANRLSVSQLSAIAADMGALTAGTITVDSTGYMRSGQTDYNTGTGFFLGRSGGASKFSIGDGGISSYLTWDGTTLAIGGSAVLGTAPLIKEIIDSGASVTISTDYVMILADRLVIDGTLTVNGTLCLAA